MFFSHVDCWQPWRRGADRGANTVKTPSGANPSPERLDLDEPDLSQDVVSTMLASLAGKVEPASRVTWRKGYKQSHEAAVAHPF
jgi:hypothetical protein